MSGRLWIGERVVGGITVRVMKDPADDPETTPPTDYDKFAFDSESGDLAYAYGINSDVSGLDYFPMVTSTVRYQADWWDLYGGIHNRLHLHGFGAIQNIWETRHSAGVSNVTPPKSLTMTMAGVNSSQTNGGRPTVQESRTLVWQLPAAGEASPFPPSEGAVPRMLLDGPVFRIARPGYEVTDADIRNFVIHENLRPAKVIASGLFTLSSGGQVDITIPEVSTTNIFVGGTCAATGHTLRIPPGFFAGGDPIVRVQYQFLNSTTIRFRDAASRATNVQYYIVAEDTSAPTSGTGSWWKELVENDETYIQIRRPQCAEPPNLADILVDSRWRVMPMVKKGYVPRASFSSRQASVAIDDLGYVPLVLVCWHIGDTITQGMIGYVASGGDPCAGWPSPFNGVSGNTRFATVTRTSITFRYYFGEAFAGNFWLGYDTFGACHEWSRSASIPETSFHGVSYYVFAIPQGDP